jgi:hypothetical protein
METTNARHALTVADLFAYAKSQAAISASDYFDPRYARADEMAAWGRDTARRNSARRRILRTFPERARSTEPLTPGNYYGGRLRITPDAIQYVPGQFAPLEVYPALFDYFTTTGKNNGNVG